MSDPLGLIGATGARPVGPAGGAHRPGAPVDPNAPNFKDLLLDQLREVNELQQEASQAVEDLQTGKRTDVDGVMMAVRKADLAFQMTLEVRNKIVDAYNEVKQVRV